MPTIAVCVGNCVGAGAEIVAGCDLRVGGDNLKLAWAGARLGVPVGPARLTQLIGLARAKDLIYTGRPIGVEEAASYGLFHRIAPAEQAEAAALDLAADITRQSADGVRALKQMFRDFEHSASGSATRTSGCSTSSAPGAGCPRASVAQAAPRRAALVSCPREPLPQRRPARHAVLRLRPRRVVGERPGAAGRPEVRRHDVDHVVVGPAPAGRRGSCCRHAARAQAWFQEPSLGSAGAGCRVVPRCQASYAAALSGSPSSAAAARCPRQLLVAVVRRPHPINPTGA